MTANGMLAWVGERKTDMEALSIGGRPQDKLSLVEVDDTTKPKYNSKGQWTGYEKKLSYSVEKASIGIPIKTKEGWKTFDAPADTANVRLSIDRRRQMQAETLNKEAGAEFKQANTSNVESLIRTREKANALAEARAQAEMMQGLGKVRFGGKNFNREPIYMVQNELGSTRDRYTITLAPNVRAGLLRNQKGLSIMSQRVLSGNTIPLTVNPLVRVGLPDVVGNRMALDNRYVQQSTRSNILEKLSPKKRRPF